MNFNDFNGTVDFLQKNFSIIQDIVPSFSRAKEAMDILIDRVTYAIAHEDVKPIDRKERDLVSEFLRHYIRGLILLNLKYTDKVIEVSEALSILVDNFSNIYLNESFYDPTGLIIRTLIQVERSLQAQIELNVYLVSRLRDILMYKDDPFDKMLSNKYYEEYIGFLNRRKNHDESYSLNPSSSKDK